NTSERQFHKTSKQQASEFISVRNSKGGFKPALTSRNSFVVMFFVVIFLRRRLKAVTITVSKHGAGQRAAVTAFFDEHFTVNDRHLDTDRLLNVALLVGRQVLHHFRLGLPA